MLYREIMAVCSEIHTKHTSIRLTKSFKYNNFIVSQVGYKKSPRASSRRQSSGEVLQQTYNKTESVLLFVSSHNRIQSTAYHTVSVWVAVCPLALR